MKGVANGQLWTVCQKALRTSATRRTTMTKLRIKGASQAYQDPPRRDQNVRSQAKYEEKSGHISGQHAMMLWARFHNEKAVIRGDNLDPPAPWGSSREIPRPASHRYSGGSHTPPQRHMARPVRMVGPWTHSEGGGGAGGSPGWGPGGGALSAPPGEAGPHTSSPPTPVQSALALTRVGLGTCVLSPAFTIPLTLPPHPPFTRPQLAPIATQLL